MTTSSLLRGNLSPETLKPGPPHTQPARDSGAVPAAARTLLALLTRLSRGSLDVTLPNGETRSFGRGDDGTPSARITVNDWRVFSAAVTRGDIGFAEAFIEGRWDTPSLPDLLDLLVMNRDAIESTVYGNWVGRLAYRIRHLLNRNSRRGSRRNIVAHYDLGNAFYRLWLDPGMTYSSALFDGAAGLTLEQGQNAKYARILDQLALPSDASVLEIGCGWGGFAERALDRGIRVTGLTLSDAQLRFATERIAGRPDGGQAAFRLEDYRDHQTIARYDGIASIEMFEAVGERYWPAYFDAIRRHLKPGGRAVIQTITIDDRLFDRYRSGTDFIQQYIFPGGMLPSPAAFESQARRAGLEVIGRHAFGLDYAQTLKRWREAFTARLDAVRQLGFDEAFIRCWTFYLAYCEAAFRQRNTDVMHFTLAHRSEGVPG